MRAENKDFVGYVPMSPFESIDFVAQWTKDKREALKLSQADVATRATELLVESGGTRTIKQQSIDQLEKRAHKGVPDWFRFVKDAIDESIESEREGRRQQTVALAPQPQQPDLPPTVADDIEMIREVDIRYAMGAGTHLEDFPEIGQIPFNRNMRRRLTHAQPELLFVARGDGDSMQPTLLNDDAVLIDTSQNRISQSDRIWALRIEDAGLIKRVRIIPRVGYELISDNPLVPPQTVAREDVAVVGRVIWIGRQV